MKKNYYSFNSRFEQVAERIINSEHGSSIIIQAEKKKERKNDKKEKLKRLLGYSKAFQHMYAEHFKKRSE